MCNTADRIASVVRRIVSLAAIVLAGAWFSACAAENVVPSESGSGAGTSTSSGLRGLVVDPDFAPLPGVRVTDPNHKLFAPVVTGTDGRFETAAVKGGVCVHVAKEGYTVDWQCVTAPARDMVFRLNRFSGRTLVFTASPSCDLPADVESRRYTVEVEDKNGAVAVRVLQPGSDSDPAGFGFAGTRERSNVSFMLTDNTWAEATFVEILPSGEEFWLTGVATGTMSETGMSLTLNGQVEVRKWWGQASTAACRASDHRLEIVQ